MPTTCCVRGCKSRGNAKDNNIKYFRFPKDETRRKMWIHAIHRENFVPTNYSMVCSLHFTTNDFQKRPDLIKLTNKAVPSIFICPENIKHNNNQKKVVMNLDSKSSPKPVRKPHNYLSDHTYVLKLPEPPASEEIQLHNTVNPSTIQVKTIKLEKSIDPSICTVQIRKLDNNSADNPYVISKLKNPTMQFIKSTCHKPHTKIMENNQNTLEVSDRKWKEIVFAQSITIKELRKKVKILQQKVRRHNSRLETLKVIVKPVCTEIIE